MQSEDLTPELPPAKAVVASCVARAWDDSVDDRDRMLLEQSAGVIQQLLRQNRSLRRFFRRQRQTATSGRLAKFSGQADVVHHWLGSPRGIRSIRDVASAYQQWAEVDVDDLAEHQLAAKLVGHICGMVESLTRADANSGAGRQKIQQAFRELEQRGYFTRQGFGCCSNCAWAEIESAGHSLVVFSDMQSDVEFRSGGDLYLQWQGNSDEIVAAMRAQGLRVDHDGRRDRAIRILPVIDDTIATPPADAQWRRRSSDDAGDGTS